MSKMTKRVGPFVTTLAVLFTTTFAVMSASADEYAREWGPAVGAQVPLLNAPDHTGVPRDLNSLAGENGLLILVNRSADW